MNFICPFRNSFPCFYTRHCHVVNSEMLRETSTQRGVQRRGHAGEKNSGIGNHLGQAWCRIRVTLSRSF